MGSDQAQFVTLEGIALHYQVAGEGAPVVFIHGGLVDSRMWDAQFAHFSEDYRVVRYDLPGFGRSEMPQSPYAHVDILKGLLAHVGLEKAYLVGLSLGGAIATEFALAHPHNVAGLVLAASDLRGYRAVGHPADEPIMLAIKRKVSGDILAEKWLEHPIFATAAEKPAAFAKLRTMLHANVDNWRRSIFARLDQWPSPAAAKRLAEIYCPTLILVGARDVADMPIIARMLEEKIPNNEKVVVEGVGHHINLEAPARFNALVAAFLARHAAPA